MPAQNFTFAGAGLEPAPGAYETPELTRALPRGDILTQTIPFEQRRKLLRSRGPANRSGPFRKSQPSFLLRPRKSCNRDRELYYFSWRGPQLSPEGWVTWPRSNCSLFRRP